MLEYRFFAVFFSAVTIATYIILISPAQMKLISMVDVAYLFSMIFS